VLLVLLELPDELPELLVPEVELVPVAYAYGLVCAVEPTAVVMLNASWIDQ
jgi:hypothetical protein